MPLPSSHHALPWSKRYGAKHFLPSSALPPYRNRRTKFHWSLGKWVMYFSSLQGQVESFPTGPEETDGGTAGTHRDPLMRPIAFALHAGHDAAGGHQTGGEVRISTPSWEMGHPGDPWRRNHVHGAALMAPVNSRAGVALWARPVVIGLASSSFTADEGTRFNTRNIGGLRASEEEVSASLRSA